MGLWARNRQTILFVVVVLGLTGLLMFSAQSGAREGIFERLLAVVLAPIQRGTSAVVGFGRGIGRFVFELHDLRGENERLRQEITALRAEQIVLVEAGLEARRLRELLGYRDVQPELPLTMAKVISRGLVAWHSEIIIDRGAQSGLSLGDPVVSPLGAVGRIIEIGEKTATVLLLTDPRSAVAATVQESRLTSVAEGDPSRLGKIRLPRLPRDFAISVGDQVTTSGLGGVFPSGQIFAIGRVSEIFVSSDGLLQFARIEPAVDFSRLEEVLVIRRRSP